MGNSKSLPLGQKVYNAAKNGKHDELQELERRMQQLGAEETINRSTLLEWEDEDGRTALIVAAAKNNYSCVDLLLRLGANVQHVSRKKDGGSALHEAVSKHGNHAVVEKLIRHGASPFVENASGFTPLDVAIARRDVVLVRQFERLGHVCGSLRMKVSSWGGLGRGWQSKWVSVVPRIPYPRLPSSEQLIRRMLFIYDNQSHPEPISKLYLDGAVSSIVNDTNGERQCIVTLHSSHPRPKKVYSKLNVNSGFSIFFKGDSQTSGIMQDFDRVISLRHGGPTVAVPASSAVAAAPAAIPPPTGVSDEEVARRLHEQLNPQRVNSAVPQVLYPTQPGHGQSNSLSAYPSISPAGYGNEDAVIQRSPIAQVDETLNSQVQGNDQSAQAEIAGPSAPPLPDQFLNSAPVVLQQNETNKEDVVATSGDIGTENPGALDDDDDDNTCVVCLAAPKEAGFVHAGSVHRCVCKSCAADLMREEHKTCPICRQRIETVITGFY